ncbi:MAG: hypothetical protein GY829_11450 [Gammaproteobacteria bacterium]|nr:hypothetical protein [Gammaproteobacteria bacterium]
MATRIPQKSIVSLLSRIVQIFLAIQGLGHSLPVYSEEESLFIADTASSETFPVFTPINSFELLSSANQKSSILVASSSIEASVIKSSEQEPATLTLENKSWAVSSAQWMELQHDNLSDVVYESALAIDRYVARDSYDDLTINKSYARFRMKQRFTERGDHKFETDMKVRVDLPSSKRKMKLFFDSSPGDFDDLDDKFRNIGTGTIEGDDAESEAVAGLRFEPNRERRWQPNLDLGMRLKLPLNPYVRVRVRRLDDWGEQWSTYFRQTLFYYRVDSWGSESDFDIYRPFAEDFLFRSASSAKYLDETKAWEHYQGFSVYQSINKKNAMEYQIAATAESEPNFRAKNYWLKIEWQRLLYKDWLFFRASPELAFPRENDFDGVASIYFEIEMFFSRYKGLRKIHEPKIHGPVNEE